MPNDRLYATYLHNITVLVPPHGVIVECAPVFARFRGADVERFKKWVRSRGGTCLREDGHARTL